jgi:hypothetical protein
VDLAFSGRFGSANFVRFRRPPMTRFTFSTAFFRYWFPAAAAARLAEIDPVRVT